MATATKKPIEKKALALREGIERLQKDLEAAKVKRDNMIVDLLDAGYTHRDIAALLLISREWVKGARMRKSYRERREVEKRAARTADK